MYSKTNISYVILIGFIILFETHSSPFYHRPYHPYERPYQGYSYSYSPNARLRCFSSDSLIKLSNGEHKQIGNLAADDEIITIDQSKVISTEMIMMLDKQMFKEVLFYTLTTDSGHKISLTEYHLIPIRNSNGNENYLFAKQIQLGDYLFVLSNGTFHYSPVRNITLEMKKGSYAPLTMQGTLLVNNVLASCFANVDNHHLAQYYMTPIRYYYHFARLISLHDPFNISQTEGVHWIVKNMFYLAYYLRLHPLFL